MQMLTDTRFIVRPFNYNTVLCYSNRAAAERIITGHGWEIVEIPKTSDFALTRGQAALVEIDTADAEIISQDVYRHQRPWSFRVNIHTHTPMIRDLVNNEDVKYEDHTRETIERYSY
jgi:hypothetical protein